MCIMLSKLYVGQTYLCFNYLFGMYTFQTHLVCTIPPYSDTSVANKIIVQVVVRCSGKQSEPQTFTYTPGKISSVIQQFKQLITFCWPKNILHKVSAIS